jgi:hypothetical protein
MYAIVSTTRKNAEAEIKKLKKDDEVLYFEC